MTHRFLCSNRRSSPRHDEAEGAHHDHPAA
jgi:hypothetical protein